MTDNVYYTASGTRWRCPLCPAPRKQLSWRAYVLHLAAEHGFTLWEAPLTGAADKHQRICCAVCGARPRYLSFSMNDSDQRWLFAHLQQHGGLAQHLLTCKLN